MENLRQSKRHIVLLMAFLMSTRAYPGNESSVEHGISEENSDVAQFKRNLLTVSYIENFKNIMADYVKSQYRNLTIHDMEAVKLTLEEFMQNFALDLHRVVVKGETEQVDVIEDGIPDSTFEDFKNSIRKQLPDVKEDTANLIIYKLRRNLYETRQKLDKIIRNSELAEIQNS